MSDARLSERAEYGVDGDIDVLVVDTDDRLGDGLGVEPNGLFDLHPTCRQSAPRHEKEECNATKAQDRRTRLPSAGAAPVPGTAAAAVAGGVVAGTAVAAAAGGAVVAGGTPAAARFAVAAPIPLADADTRPNGT